jgi:hypothetical protein
MFILADYVSRVCRWEERAGQDVRFGVERLSADEVVGLEASIEEKSAACMISSCA